MLLSFAQWIQLTGFFTALRGSAYVYPIVMSLHMVGIAFFGGMVFMTDMRLLGWGMRKRSIADVIDQFRVPKRWGLPLTITCGILMAGSKAEEYYYNAFFRTKLILLATVIVFELLFYRSVYANPAALDHECSWERETGGCAFPAALDFHRLLRARIGYIEPPLDKLHAQMHFMKDSALAALRGPSLLKGQDH